VLILRGDVPHSLSALTELNARGRKAGVFQLDLPLSPLKLGFYACQVNVGDDAGSLYLVTTPWVADSNRKHDRSSLGLRRTST